MSQSTPWVWVEVVCNGCDCSHFGRHVRAGTTHVRGDIGRMTREARKHWKIDDHGDWWCDDCQLREQP